MCGHPLSNATKYQLITVYRNDFFASRTLFNAADLLVQCLVLLVTLLFSSSHDLDTEAVLLQSKKL